MIGGKTRRLEESGGTHVRGGNCLPFADQKSVGGNAQRGVMMKAAPAAAFEVPKADLLLEILIVALDAPAQLCKVDQTCERDFLWKLREPVFDRFSFALGATRSTAILQAAPRTGCNRDGRHERAGVRNAR